VAPGLRRHRQLCGHHQRRPQRAQHHLGVCVSVSLSVSVSVGVGVGVGVSLSVSVSVGVSLSVSVGVGVSVSVSVGFGVSVGVGVGVGVGGQILWRCRSLRPITIRWISLVPSPISSSGASRYRRSISYSLE